MRARRDQPRGQSTVELAAVLPFILAIVLFIIQVGLVLRDQILVVHAARTAARAAAVGADGDAAARHAGGLDPTRLVVDVRRVDRQGQPLVEATVRYRAETTVPLVGALVGDLTLSESATMRVEGG